MKYLSWMLLISAVYLTVLARPAVAAETARKNLVMQISEDSMDKAAFSLNAAIFLKNHYGKENIEVLIVAYGKGVLPFRWEAPIPIVEKIKQARALGVRIALSEKSMRKRKLRPSDMRPEVDYVRFGEGEIIEKRYLGWVYLRL
ncbi:MAG: hypothetical protein GY862_29970 [Gammaproteobacteria bacterium]|nr:hypothetical protein [Gammaproteobacteria bacterium]